MTYNQMMRAERRRIKREREARANRAAAKAIALLILIIVLLALGACVLEGPSDAELMQAECDEWAARGVYIFE